MRSRETAPVTAKETATATTTARRRREDGGGEVACAEREIGEDFLGRVPFIQIHLLVPGGYTTRY